MCTDALRAVPAQYARRRGNLRAPTSPDSRNPSLHPPGSGKHRFIQAQCNTPETGRGSASSPAAKAHRLVSFGGIQAGARDQAERIPALVPIDQHVPETMSSVDKPSAQAAAPSSHRVHLARPLRQGSSPLRRALLAWCVVFSNGCGAAATDDTTNALGCEIGTEGCACYGNWSCNYQLSCVDDSCVDLRKNSSNSEQSETALLVIDPIVAVTTEQCMNCIDKHCVSPLAECYVEAGCASLFGCLLPCGQASARDDDSCSDACYAEGPLSAHVQQSQLQMCAHSQCERACYED